MITGKVHAKMKVLEAELEKLKKKSPVKKAPVKKKTPVKKKA